jgi:hypothetical protein
MRRGARAGERDNVKPWIRATASSERVRSARCDGSHIFQRPKKRHSSLNIRRRRLTGRVVQLEHLLLNHEMNLSLRGGALCTSCRDVGSARCKERPRELCR